MNEDCFVELLNVVKPFIMKKNTQLRDAIPPEESLALVLRFSATGETFRSLDFQTRNSLAYISPLVPYCCYVLYTILKHKYLRFPTCAGWKKVANDFMQRWQFPLCLGALDGKHIGFRSSKIDRSLYYNYKGFNSNV